MPVASGKVYLVGAGPGDPELLTVKATRLLASADVVLYDRLVSAEALVLSNPNAQVIFVGKIQGEQEVVQAHINSLMLHHAKLGRTVVRLKSGDPMIFGRGGEELDFLIEHGIAAEIVPGVSSVVAAPALAGIPLTFRGLAGGFAVVAGHRQHQDQEDWRPYAAIDTLVVVMGVENRQAIARTLMALGRPASLPVAFVHSASTEREAVVVSTLDEVAKGQVSVSSPAIFVIGEVVRLRARLMQIHSVVKTEGIAQ